MAFNNACCLTAEDYHDITAVYISAAGATTKYLYNCCPPCEPRQPHMHSLAWPGPLADLNQTNFISVNTVKVRICTSTS